MIQRVQSIWLLLATLTLICLFFLPLMTKAINGTEYLLYINGHHQTTTTAGEVSKTVTPISGLILNGAAILLCLATIFQFKNRQMQKRLIIITILLITATAILSALNASLFPGGFSGASLHPGFSLFLFAFVFCVLAFRGIRKDEQLLRSADRLR